jgi:hypothetical protein
MLLHLIRRVIQSNVKVQDIAEIDAIWLKAQHLITQAETALNTALSISPDNPANDHIKEALQLLETLKKT